MKNKMSSREKMAMGFLIAKLFTIPVFVTTVISPLMFTSCGRNRTKESWQRTITTNATDHPNLVAGRPITVIFPAGFDMNDLFIIEGNFADIVKRLSFLAGLGDVVKVAIDEILNRPNGLRIYIENTDIIVDIKTGSPKQVRAGAESMKNSDWINMIAMDIINMAVGGDFAMANQSSNVYMAGGDQVKQLIQKYDGQQKRNNMLAKMG